MGDDTASAVAEGSRKFGRSQRRSKRDRDGGDGAFSGSKKDGGGSSATTKTPPGVGVASGLGVGSADPVENGYDTTLTDYDGGTKVKELKNKVGGRRGKKMKLENHDVDMQEVDSSKLRRIYREGERMNGSSNNDDDFRTWGSREVNVRIIMNDGSKEIKMKPILRAKLSDVAAITGATEEDFHGQQRIQQQQYPPPQARLESNDICTEGQNEETIIGVGTSNTDTEEYPPSVDDNDSSAKALTSPPPNKSRNTPKGSQYCAHESCTKYRQSGCYGYCHSHKLNADPDLQAIKRNIAEHSSDLKKRTLNKSNLCKWPSCTKYIQSNCNGYCLTHVKYANYEEGDVYDVTKVRVRIASRLQNGFCRAMLPLELRIRWGFEVGGGGEINDSGNNNSGEAPSPVKGHASGGVGGILGNSDGGCDGSLDDTNDGENNTGNDGVDRNQFQNDIVTSIPDSSTFSEASNGASICRDVECPVTSQEFSRNKGNEMEIPDDIALGLTAEGGFQSLRTYVPPEYVAHLSMEPLLNDRGRTLCKIFGCGKLDQTNNDGFCRMHFHMFEVREKSDDDWTCGCGLLIAGTQKRCGTCNKWRGGKRESYDANKGETQSEDVDDDGEPWMCDCGNEVASKKSRCGSCHHWRGGKRLGGWTLGAGRDYESDDGIDRTQDWTCCGDIISSKQTRCGKCNGWRGGKRVFSNAGSESSSKSPPPNLPPWVCIKCQMSNPGNKKRCGGCLTWKSNVPTTSKPSRGSRKSTGNRDSTDKVDPNAGGHWKCMNCNFDNFSRELSCFICQSMRPNHQWHKKQQIINSTPGNSTQYPTVATPTLAAAFANPSAGAAPPAPGNFNSIADSQIDSASTTAMAGSMNSHCAAADSNRCATANNRDIFVADIISNPPDTMNYYGTYNESLIYPYVSIHYDFNRAYYYNHDYTYLNAGVGSIHSGGVGEDCRSQDK